MKIDATYRAAQTEREEGVYHLVDLQSSKRCINVGTLRPTSPVRDHAYKQEMQAWCWCLV